MPEAAEKREELILWPMAYGLLPVASFNGITLACNLRMPRSQRS